MVVEPSSNVMVTLSSLRRAARSFQRSHPARPAHKVGLADALEFAFIRQQVHDRLRRFRGEEAGDGLLQIKISLGERTIRKHRRVEMSLRLRSRADPAHKSGGSGRRSASCESHDEDGIAFIRALSTE